MRHEAGDLGTRAYVRPGTRENGPRGGDNDRRGTGPHVHDSWQVLVEGKSITRTTTVYVGMQTGLPRRSVSPLVRGDYILDYYDYGAHIEIPLPPC